MAGREDLINASPRTRVRLQVFAGRSPPIGGSQVAARPRHPSPRHDSFHPIGRGVLCGSGRRRVQVQASGSPRGARLRVPARAPCSDRLRGNPCVAEPRVAPLAHGTRRSRGRQTRRAGPRARDPRSRRSLSPRFPNQTAGRPASPDFGLVARQTRPVAGASDRTQQERARTPQQKEARASHARAPSFAISLVRRSRRRRIVVHDGTDRFAIANRGVDGP